MKIGLYNFFTMIVILFICTPLIANGSKATKKSLSIQEQLVSLEASAEGRLGVYAINTADNIYLQYRGQERFPFGSTAKVIVVAAILQQSMTDKNIMRQLITYKKEDLAGYSPVTKKHLTDGMTISELCAAAISQSDNIAVNLLIKRLGGLQAVNAFAHSIGDNKFKLDRLEPDLNSAIPGDHRDTSTPAAMAKDLRLLTLDKTLGSSQRKELLVWLKKNVTGYSRIRAGLPKNWVVGDKTGTSDYGTTNDIAVIWPPTCNPIVVAIYFTQNAQNAIPRDDVIVNATKLLINDFSGKSKCIASQIGNKM